VPGLCRLQVRAYWVSIPDPECNIFWTNFNVRFGFRLLVCDMAIGDSSAMLSIRNDIAVRCATVSDAAAVAAVHRESWSQCYRGMIPHHELTCMVRRRGVVWWRSAIAAGETIIVLEVKNQIVGYATCGRARWKRFGEGEVYELYLLPVYQGLGLGEVLFEGCLGVLDEVGYRGAVVWVLADNERAISFYWARGGRQVAKAQHRLGGSSVEKLAFAWN
jgi:ribosomal protein S18 acetylase RimI-like enzyme